MNKIKKFKINFSANLRSMNINNRFKEAYDRVEMADTIRESVLDPGLYLNETSSNNQTTEKSIHNHTSLLNKEKP